VFNVSKQKTEKVSRLYVASADELTEEASMSEGNIAVVSGLKECVTGDTLTSSASAARAARCWLAARQGVAEADVAPVLAGVQVPDPVFFCSIEPSSLVRLSLSSNDPSSSFFVPAHIRVRFGNLT